MTCVVAIADGETVWMGADSMAINGDERIILNQPKVTRLETSRGQPYLVGCAGALRIMNLVVELALEVPDKGFFDSPLSFVRSAFLPTLHSLLKANDALDEDGGMCSQMLIGYRGHIVQIGTDFSIWATSDPYAAIGGGASYALGALHTHWSLKYLKRETFDDCGIEALNSAAKFSSSVSAPFIQRWLYQEDWDKA